MRDMLITSSILIIAILIVRCLVKGRINPLLQYALWLLVVLRLVIPVSLFSSPVSVLNLLPDERSYMADAADGAALTDGGPAAADSMENRETGNAEDSKTAAELPAYEQGGYSLQDILKLTGIQNKDSVPEKDNMSDAGSGDAVASDDRNKDGSLLNKFSDIAIPVWIAGIVLVGGYMLFYQIKWMQYLHRHRKPLKNREKYRGSLYVYTVNGLPFPCLTGRSIYVTKEMAADQKKLEHILAHEYCHYRHLDSVWVIVRCVLAAVYWFHPLVWVAAYVSKQDSELACDMAAIRMLGENERIAYGKTLLQLISRASYDRNRIGIASTMGSGEKEIRERIALIARKPKYIMAAAGLVVLIAAALAAVTFSGKGQEQAQSFSEAEGQEQAQLSGEAEGQEQAQLSGETEGQEQAQLSGETEGQEQAQLSGEEEGQEQIQLLSKEDSQNQQDDVQAQEEAKDLFEKLSSYDLQIIPSGIQAQTVETSGVMKPSDYVQAFYDKGENALEEGMYLLEEKQGTDHSGIKIYGMYTKEFGCRGIKTLVGGDVNNYDKTWTLGYGYGREENLSIYEHAEDGMPRTFAWKTAIVRSSDSEIWKLYLGDRYDTGTIELNEFGADDYMPQIQKRLQFEIAESGTKIIVYDSGVKVGEINRDSSDAMKALKEIKEVVVDGSTVGWELGGSEEELRLIVALGVKLETGKVWYQGMPFISFPVECGYFGERTFTLGQAEVESNYKNGMIQTMPDTTDEQAGGQSGSSAAVGVGYMNPCPSYTRTNPITHEGVDLAAEKGADIVAAADGVVEETGYDPENGNYVILYHSANQEYTYYCGCAEILVSQGDTVAGGHKIATVGATGRSTVPHLHFAVKKDGEYIEPVFE